MQQRFLWLVAVMLVFAASSCREARMNEHEAWKAKFDKYGISKGCFMLRDHTHETIHYYNKERCIDTFMPASTFKILNSLIALETGIAKDDQLMIPWDGNPTRQPCEKDMTMREAFRLSCLNYYQSLARRIGPSMMQHYLDTVKYGNMRMGDSVDAFWVNNTLKISADEQLGFIRKLYFNELPFSELNQRIVRSMMRQSDDSNGRLAYKTGWGTYPDGHSILWVVGYQEIVEEVEELKGSMNKSGIRTYPYFFALNFDITDQDTAWTDKRISLLMDLLKAYHEGK